MVKLLMAVEFFLFFQKINKQCENFFNSICMILFFSLYIYINKNIFFYFFLISSKIKTNKKVNLNVFCRIKYIFMFRKIGL